VNLHGDQSFDHIDLLRLTKQVYETLECVDRQVVNIWLRLHDLDDVLLHLIQDNIEHVVSRHHDVNDYVEALETEILVADDGQLDKDGNQS
jgi:GTP cyclohydrolase III